MLRMVDSGAAEYVFEQLSDIHHAGESIGQRDFAPVHDANATNAAAELAMFRSQRNLR